MSLGVGGLGLAELGLAGGSDFGGAPLRLLTRTRTRTRTRTLILTLALALALALALIRTAPKAVSSRYSAPPACWMGARLLDGSQRLATSTRWQWSSVWTARRCPYPYPYP